MVNCLKIPFTKNLNIPHLEDIISTLPTTGKLKISNNNLIYLDIDDNYIHHVFPLLTSFDVKKPNYFDTHSAGAHITVIYPEEHKIINKEDLEQDHHFSIKNMVATEILTKTYYTLLIDSSSLAQLRRKYNLPDRLCFKGYWVKFHITIGVNT